MKDLKLKKLADRDLNEFRDELFVYLAMLFNADSQALEKTLNRFLVDLEKVLIRVHNNKPLKGKNSRTRRK